MVVLELLHRDGASVIHSSNEAGTFYGKGHIVFGIRTQISIFVQNLNRNETQVFAICLNGTAVRAETNLCRFTRCPDFLLGHSLSFLAGNSLYRTRLILHAPHDVEIVFSLVAHTLRLSIHEKLHFVGIVIICPQIYVLSLRPIPMWEKMQHRLVRTPLGLIHIVDVLREASQVDNAKVRATCRPTVRSRLTDIIEARPDVLSTDKVVVLYMAHSTFVTVAPRNMTVVVGGARERGIIERLVPTFGPDEHRITRHPVVTACHQAGNTFRYDERLTGEVHGNTCKPVVMVIEADNIKRTGTEQMIVRIRLVAACRHGARDIELSHHIRQFLCQQ